MKAIQQTGLVMGAAALFAASGQAQTFTKLLGEGDAVPISDGIVVNVQNCDVNDSGDWLIEFDAGAVNDLAVMHNGTVIYQEGTNTGFPATHTVMGGNDWLAGTSTDAMDINDNGDMLVHWRSCTDVNAILPSRDIIFWTNGTTGITYALLEEELTPSDTMTGEPAGSEEAMGAVWSTISEVWQNNNNQLFVHGRTTTDTTRDTYAFMEHDGAGNIVSQVMVATEGVNHATAFGGTGTHADTVQGFSASKQYNCLNNNGDYIFPVDDESFGPGGMPSYTDVDGHIYLGTTELIWEADVSPVDPMTVWGSPTSWEVDINDSGTWVIGADDDGATATDSFIMVTDSGGSSSIFIREGDMLPDIDPMLGITAGFGWGFVQISDSGDITWHNNSTEATAAPYDDCLYRNNTLLASTDVTVLPGYDGIDDISSSADGMAVSDNGRFIIVEMDMEPIGGDPASSSDDLETIWLIDFGSAFTDLCNGDGGDQMGCTDCPCANNAAPGTIGGCVNSGGGSTRLHATGDASVSLPNGATTDLGFTASGLPATAFGVLLSDAAVGPLNMMNPCFGMQSGTLAADRDGLRCIAGGSGQRHGGRSADANGDTGITNNGWGGAFAPPAGIAVAGGFAAGQTRYFQLNHREDAMAVCMRGLNSSQAIEVTFTP